MPRAVGAEARRRPASARPLRPGAAASRSARTSSRKRSSRSIRSPSVSSSRRAAGSASQPRPSPAGARGGRGAARRAVPRGSSSVSSSPTHPTRGRSGFLPEERSGWSTSRSRARHRAIRLAIVPGGEVELGADRPVALVPREEAVEDLAAVGREPVERGADGHRLVELCEAVVGGLGRARPRASRALTGAARRPAQRLVGWAIQGRSASASRSVSSRSKTRAKTSWKTSSASSARAGRRAARSRGRSARTGRRARPRRRPHLRGSVPPARSRTRRPTAPPPSPSARLGGPKPLGQELEQLPRDFRPGLREAPEAPHGQRVGAELRRRGDGGRPGRLVDEGDLAERGAGPERADRLPPTVTSAVPLSTTKKFRPPSPSVAIAWSGWNSRSTKSFASCRSDESSSSAKIGMLRISSGEGRATARPYRPATIVSRGIVGTRAA